MTPDDAIRVRRARIGRVVKLAKRVGYLALLAAIVAFFVGLVIGFPRWSVTIVIAGLIASCIILPVPIVLGYGLRAAEREDRSRGE